MVEGWDDLRPELQEFALEMEKKLRANDHKPLWKNDDPFRFLNRVREETVELSEAMLLGREREITEEAADVANFALFISAIYKSRRSR